MDSNMNFATQCNEVQETTNINNMPQGQTWANQNQYIQPVNIYNIPGIETPEQKQERARIFHVLALPTLLYAILYTFCLYDNFSSITMPLFVLTTIIYVFYCMSQLGIKRKKDSYLYASVMLLLGISNAVTANEVILLFNNIGIVLILLCMLLHNYFEDKSWTLGKYISAMFTAVFGAVGCIGEPFSDASCYHREETKKRNTVLTYILIGIGIAIPFLIVVVSLLYFADAVFASILRESFQLDISAGTVIGIVCMFLFAMFSAYCGLRYLGKKKISETCKESPKWEPVVAITVLVLVSVVYLFFSLIQIVYLFPGKMELPEGYTYAAYAREGFFQLLFVCIMNVALVLFILHSFKESRVLKGLLIVISACTYIMVASSAFRMILYIQNYHLTLLRILVLWALAVIAVLLAGILVQIMKKDFPLFRYGLVVVCIGYLLLSFGRPDYFIAKYNLANMDENSEQADYFYLENLSADAAPVIENYDGVWVQKYARNLANDTNDKLRKFNFSRAYARNHFADRIRMYEEVE